MSWTGVSLLKAAWAKWKAIAHVIADFQARVLLAIFYLLVLGPFALVLRGFADPLGIHARNGSTWRTRPAHEGDPWVAAWRQF